MKKLEYLNLALNNITKIENLEGCESLNKLDLTVNFVDDLLSVESLTGNYNLRELFLTGNPCTEYEGYRDFVIATLPQLESLDGQTISRTERILATQVLEANRWKIGIQQREYIKREEIRRSQDSNVKMERLSDESEYDSEEEKNFWKTKCDNTPETRVKITKHILKSREKKNPSEKKEPQKERRLFHENGKAFNINEAKLDFKFVEDETNNNLILDLSIYKFMDSSLLSVDVQPLYVRVLVRNKFFQLSLWDEVCPDRSTAQRSATTGHLVITMPKAKECLTRPATDKTANKKETPKEERKEDKPELLEVKEDQQPMAVLHRITEKSDKVQRKVDESERIVKCDEYDDNFVDNPDVPPLIYA
ncbi:LRRC6 [Cordylochernes scorpioides]|uniref:LRRC6 n=1 Tax=Cordylochernes scorpioides TaxID=51811 RepID=A0ABY6KUL5_9ARAC|nr:LRRC6 [Cordylochernes scorpioides]